MPLSVKYDTFREKALGSAREGHYAGSVACGLLALLSSVGTYIVISNQSDTAIVILCEAATVFLIITLGVTLYSAFTVADKPADMKSITDLTMMIDRLGSDQKEFIVEISTLLRGQDVLYQYQVEALTEAVKKHDSGLDAKQITDRISTIRQGLGM